MQFELSLFDQALYKPVPKESSQMNSQDQMNTAFCRLLTARSNCPFRNQAFPS
jgi:hypothetical protein